jgi:hypothetical protein
LTIGFDCHILPLIDADMKNGISYLKLCLAPLAVCFAIFLSSGCGQAEKRENPAGTKAATAKADSLTIELGGQNGLSVFDILRRSRRVDFLRTPAGVFIKSVDSIATGDGYVWLYSVNNIMASIAADKYITADTDIIKWHFRKM